MNKSAFSRPSIASILKMLLLLSLTAPTGVSVIGNLSGNLSETAFAAETISLLTELKATKKADLEATFARLSAEVKANPKKSEAYAARVFIAERLGYKKQAEQLQDEALKRFGEGIFYAELAMMYEATGDLESTIRYENLSLAKRPHRHLYASRANCLRATGHYKESIKDADKALANGFEDKSAIYTMKAFTYEQWGKPKEALAEYDRAIVADNKNANRYIERGAFYRNIGQFQKAKQDATTAIKLDEKKPVSYKLLAAICSNLKDFDGMFAAMHKAYSLDKTNPATRVQFSQCIAAQFDQFKKCADQHCIDRCNKLIASYSTEFWPYTLRAMLYAHLTNNKAALADYSKAIALGDRSEITYEGRGNVLMLENRVSEAIADYSKAISINPTLNRLYLERADAYRTARMSDRAIDDYSRVASKCPKSLHTHRNLGKALVDQHRYEEAVTAFTSELKNFPLDSQAFADRSKAYLSLKRNDKALADINDAITLEPKQPILYRQRAQIYEKLGDSKAASRDHAKADSFGKALIEY